MEMKSLLSLVTDALGEEVSENSTSASVSNWDSLGHIQILSKLDEDYDNITLKIPELGSCSSIKELHSLLETVG